MAFDKITTIICLLAQLLTFALAKDNRFHLRTERNITGQIVDVQKITADRSLLSDGYLFFAPGTWAQGWGPKIYDIDGHLIWDGRDRIDHIAQQFYACDFEGSLGTHLCWHEASALGINRKDSNISVHDYQRIFDNTYTQVGQNYTTVGKLQSSMIDINTMNKASEPATPDSHEFNVVNGGTSYLQTVYFRKQMDLSQWTGPVEGWLLESCFQDVELNTEKILFRWCYTDHLPIESRIYVSSARQRNFTTQLAGDGSWFGAWDFFHINSVDRNDENDYLISGRHNDQIIKIAGNNSPNGAPGDVLWRLGGDSNQFEYEGDFVFSRQHDARFVGTYDEWTHLTIFDNAWEGEGDDSQKSQPYSSGKLITVNNVTMKAKLLQEYPHPEGKLCRSGGSMQMLPNKNMFLGWGFIRQVTEFKYDGNVLFHAHLNNADGLEINNYRNYKYPWVGSPAADPKLIAYTQSCETDSSAPLMAYISWNGATEVARWRFRTADFPTGPWIHRTTIRKTDFETRATVSNRFHPYLKAEALDARGRVIRSITKPTFVPSDKAIRAGCGQDGCDNEKFADYDLEYSIADTCKRHYSFPIIGLVMTIVFIELCSWFYTLTVGLQRLRKTGSGELGVYAMLEQHGKSSEKAGIKLAV